MRSMGLLSFALLAACQAAETGGEGNGAAVSGSDGKAAPTTTTVAVPAGGGPSGLDAVMGATPGPCGSTKASDLVGQIYTPELDSKLRARTGASDVRVVRPGEYLDPAEPQPPPVERRLNVLLNRAGQIIMLDCG